MFDGGDGVLGVIGSILPPPNTASWVDATELDFGLIWPQHFHPVLLWIIQMCIGKLQIGLWSLKKIKVLQDAIEEPFSLNGSMKNL